MPDILILTKEDPEIVSLDAVVTAQGIRAKSVSDSSVAKEWLALHPFDALLSSATISVEEQQDIAGKLWEKNPLARYFIYTTHNLGRKAFDASRLSGSELLKGREALAKVCGTIKERSATKTNFSVVVVEDLDSPRDIICSYIESLGFSDVVGIRSANEAMTMLEATPRETHIVVSDLRMPEISGEAFIRMVRAHPKLKHIPIIVLTAHGTLDALVDSLKSGASGFLVKPPKKRDLLRELSRACRILAQKESPRLASEDEVELLRDVIEERF